MKKILIILSIVFVLLAGAGIGAWFYFHQKPLAVEEILPEKPLVYLRWINPQKTVEQFLASTFWDKISEIDYDLILDRSHSDPQNKLMIQSVFENLSNASNVDFLKKFFGKDVAIAIYPSAMQIDANDPAIKANPVKAIENVLSGLFLIIRVDKDIQAAELISGLFKKPASSLVNETVKYKGHTIHVLTISELNIKVALTRFNDLMVIGIGDVAVKRSIDQAKLKKGSMAQDPDFIAAQSKSVAGATMLSYWAFNDIFTIFKAQMDKWIEMSSRSNTQIDKEQYDQFFKSLSALGKMSASAKWDEISQVRLDITFDKDALDPEISELYDCVSSENATIKFVPKDVLIYQWGGCLKLESFWKQVKKESAKLPLVTHQKVLDQDQNLIPEQSAPVPYKLPENILGLNIEQDIIPAFGQEFGGYWSDLKVGESFPIPEILFFVKISDKSKIDKILSEITEQPIFVSQLENYKDIKINYFSLMSKEDIQPSYCYLGDYLLIGINRATIKKAIDTSLDPSVNLTQNPKFNNVNLGLTDKNAGVGFVNVNEIINKIETIIKWGDSWAQDQAARAMAFQSGTKKKLSEVKAIVEDLDFQQKRTKEEVDTLRNVVKNLQNAGQDVTAKQAALTELEKKFNILSEELMTRDNERLKLLRTVQGFADPQAGEDDRKFYLDQLAFPILNAIRSIDAVGTRSTMSSGFIELDMIIKSEE